MINDKNSGQDVFRFSTDSTQAILIFEHLLSSLFVDAVFPEQMFFLSFISVVFLLFIQNVFLFNLL